MLVSSAALAFLLICRAGDGGGGVFVSPLLLIDGGESPGALLLLF